MSKIPRTAIPITLEENLLKIIETQNEIKSAPNWKLVREHDGLTKQSKEIIWLEWDKNGRFKAKHNGPAVGRSLLMSPFNDFFTWQTTDITEILELSSDFSYVKFKTKNSNYELFKL
jgi:hypothetical protein